MLKLSSCVSENYSYRLSPISRLTLICKMPCFGCCRTYSDHASGPQQCEKQGHGGSRAKQPPREPSSGSSRSSRSQTRPVAAGRQTSVSTNPSGAAGDSSHHPAASRTQGRQQAKQTATSRASSKSREHSNSPRGPPSSSGSGSSKSNKESRRQTSQAARGREGSSASGCLRDKVGSTSEPPPPPERSRVEDQPQERPFGSFMGGIGSETPKQAGSSPLPAMPAQSSTTDQRLDQFPRPPGTLSRLPAGV